MQRRYLIFGIIITVGVVLDQWTKQLVADHIHSVRDFHHIFPVLSIVRTHNTGISFGMLSALNLGPWFYGVLIILVLAFLVYTVIITANLGLQTAVVFMISGAIGNLVDRLARGYVIDFISLHWFDKYYFYVFNIADILVSCGAALIILDALIKKRTS